MQFCNMLLNQQSTNFSYPAFSNHVFVQLESMRLPEDVTLEETENIDFMWVLKKVHMPAYSVSFLDSGACSICDIFDKEYMSDLLE